MSDNREALEYLFNSTMTSGDALDAIDTLDAYRNEIAHELAEVLRASASRVTPSGHLSGAHGAADLIDPEVQECD